MTKPDLPTWQLKTHALLPIVQGGMGIGISAHRLAGTVARLGALGTISSVDLRHHHPDLLQRSAKCTDKNALDKLNLIALDREIRQALEISNGCGAIAVNVMKAVSDYAAYVRQSCESGAHAIVVGAGLPFGLPDLVKDFPDVALLPILSDARGVDIVLRKWMRKNRLPDAIVIEHPRFAGGHLGATRIDDIDDPRFDFANVLSDVLELLHDLGIERERIPLIVAGGINSHASARRCLALGASAVQIGTPFAVTEEGDAHVNFKKVLADAGPGDIVTFMSVSGLPARAVLTPWLANYLKREKALQSHAKADARRCVQGLNCLAVCGLRDGHASMGQFCIDTRLAFALKGDVKKGLFFRGSESLPFGTAIRPVAELIDYFLTGTMPLTGDCAAMVIARVYYEEKFGTKPVDGFEEFAKGVPSPDRWRRPISPEEKQMSGPRNHVALVTGASRGVGAETALLLARNGYDIVLNYHTKRARADEVASAVRALGQFALVVQADLTRPADVTAMMQSVGSEFRHIDALVLNASGGLEKGKPPDYAMRLNVDAQLCVVDNALPLMRLGGRIVFVTSHMAHFYATKGSSGPYEPVAASKYAGEQALRARRAEFSALGLTLQVVSGDVIEGTITSKLLARMNPAMALARREKSAPLPTVPEFAGAIAGAVFRPAPVESTIYVGSTD